MKGIYDNMGFENPYWPRPPGNTVVKKNINCWSFGSNGYANKIYDNMGIGNPNWPRPPGNTVVKKNINCWSFGSDKLKNIKLKDLGKRIIELVKKRKYVGLSATEQLELSGLELEIYKRIQKGDDDYDTLILMQQTMANVSSPENLKNWIKKSRKFGKSRKKRKSRKKSRKSRKSRKTRKSRKSRKKRKSKRKSRKSRKFGMNVGDIEDKAASNIILKLNSNNPFKKLKSPQEYDRKSIDLEKKLKLKCPSRPYQDKVDGLKGFKLSGEGFEMRKALYKKLDGVKNGSVKISKDDAFNQTEPHANIDAYMRYKLMDEYWNKCIGKSTGGFR